MGIETTSKMEKVRCILALITQNATLKLRLACHPEKRR